MRARRARREALRADALTRAQMSSYPSRSNRRPRCVATADSFGERSGRPLRILLVLLHLLDGVLPVVVLHLDRLLQRRGDVVDQCLIGRGGRLVTRIWYGHSEVDDRDEPMVCHVLPLLPLAGHVPRNTPQAVKSATTSLLDSIPCRRNGRS